MRVPMLLALATILSARQKTADDPAVTTLSQVRRIYVGPLVGGAPADSLRELIIASIDSASLNSASMGSQKLFLLTEDPERADAVLKGAADDNAFEDTFDSSEGVSSHTNGNSRTTTGTSKAARGMGGAGISDNETHHIKERKHEAYAAVRLCSRNGDVLWSTTQESRGAKFRGASADVAAKIARQLALDMERAARPAAAGKSP